MKHYINKDVYTSACERLDVIYKEFDDVCVSFSNGKDSGVLLNLAIEAARRHNKLPVKALYIDMEAQYKHAIDFTEYSFNREEVVGWWVCLPLHLRNAVSQMQPHWLCWDEDCKDAWVRELPKSEYMVNDPKYFPFFKHGMEFEEFVPKFAEWFSGYDKKKVCQLVGIRSDESLNRYRTIVSESKVRYKDYGWTTKINPKKDDKIYNAYPIYDWHVKDIWRANGKFGWKYNKVYDIMYKAGVSLHKQRLCQPYGDDQRQGLYLFKALEPNTWAKVVNRVEGANFGNRYTETNRTALGNFKINLPKGHTYESYAKFLLDTMPKNQREHYMEKINKFLGWYKKKGMDTIPDFDDIKLESARKAPSWRRICKVLLKNDYWCKGLSFAQTKGELKRQLELTKKYMAL